MLRRQREKRKRFRARKGENTEFLFYTTFFEEKEDAGAFELGLLLHAQSRFPDQVGPLLLVNVHDRVIDLFAMNFPPVLENCNVPLIAPDGSFPRHRVGALAVQDARIVGTPALPGDFVDLARRRGDARRDALVQHRHDPRGGRALAVVAEREMHLAEKRELLVRAAEMAESAAGPDHKIDRAAQLGGDLLGEVLPEAFDPFN